MDIQPQKSHHGQTVAQVAKDKTNMDTAAPHDKSVSDIANSKSVRQLSRDYTNASILAAHEKVSLSSGDEAMSLLYKAAIEAIDEHLAPTMGENATQKIYDQGIDTSPEATAGRIVDFATQFFSMYQEQNSSMEFDEQLSSFMGIIGDAVDVGFGEAREILDGLQVLEGKISDDIDTTYGLVQQGFQDFYDSFYQDDESEQSIVD